MYWGGVFLFSVVLCGTLTGWKFGRVDKPTGCVKEGDKQQSVNHHKCVDMPTGILESNDNKNIANTK
jgi:hypothetical protein